MRYCVPFVGMITLSALVLLAGPLGSQTADRDRVDRAIDRALAFLSSMQEPDGAWQAHGKNPAITSLAVMAFLSAGHVPGEGPYGKVVEKGIRSVLRRQNAAGVISADGNQEMYHQGICTLMLAEAAGMTDGALGQELRLKLQKAVQVILLAQQTRESPHRGGWRYRVTSNDADLSVTGWQLLALRAAKNLGCDVPPERIDLAVQYLLRSHDPRSGGFRYQVGGNVTVPCTGTGILGLEICGKDRHHTPEALQAGSYLLKHLPRWEEAHFFYGVYYCSQATFQLGKNYWTFFRPHLHKVLLDHQGDNGSWVGHDGYGANYGSAMAVLALTVEYRFLPIYQRAEEAEEGTK
jgi:hypothetical protein